MKNILPINENQLRFLNLDKDIIQKRVSILTSSENYSELYIDINDDIFEKLKDIAKDLGLNIEDIVLSSIIDIMLIYKQQELEEKRKLENWIAIDSIIYEVKKEEIEKNSFNYEIYDTRTFSKILELVK